MTKLTTKKLRIVIFLGVLLIGMLLVNNVQQTLAAGKEELKIASELAPGEVNEEEFEGVDKGLPPEEDTTPKEKVILPEEGEVGKGSNLLLVLGIIAIIVAAIIIVGVIVYSFTKKKEETH